MNKKLLIIAASLSVGVLLLTPPAMAGTATTVTVDGASNNGSVNSFTWAVGAPDKYTWWPGNAALKQRISDAKIKLVRVGSIQLGSYNGRDIYPSANNWNFTALDSILSTIFDAGAQPLFIVAGFPGGVPHTLDSQQRITSADWNAYATFMDGVVNRYNVQKALGAARTIQYFEMWNEPTIEGDGKFISQADYKTFVQIVGGRMKTRDSSIRLIGPVDSWSDLGTAGYISYTAKNLESQIDVLSWHDYGPGPSDTDANRMAWTKPHYQDNIATVRTGGTDGRFRGPSGKLFGSAITEYNMSWQGGDASYNAKYHNEYNATFLASAIVNAMKGGAEIFSMYTLAETGQNLLGLLVNTDYSPYKPYYVIHMFGNYFGNQKLNATGGTSSLEFIAAKKTSANTYTVVLVNKSTTGITYDATVVVNNMGYTSGTVTIRRLNAAANPTSSTSASYSNSRYLYSVPPYNVVLLEFAGSTSGGTTLFSTGFESGHAQPTWLDSIEQSSNVGPYTGATVPECSPRQETARGIGALMYSGRDNATTTSYCNYRVFDVNIPVASSTKLSYWIYPQQDNGRYVAIDFICTDGTTLRDSGAVDYNGFSMHPNAGHGGAIPLNAWSQIKSNIGQWLNGKTIDRINVNYDRPSNTGDYRGYLDDILITNGTLP